MYIKGFPDSGDGRRVSAVLQIKIWSDGALSVEGPVGDTAWCLAVLENAKDAIKNQARPKDAIVVPGGEVSLT